MQYINVFYDLKACIIIEIVTADSTGLKACFHTLFFMEVKILRGSNNLHHICGQQDPLEKRQAQSHRNQSVVEHLTHSKHTVDDWTDSSQLSEKERRAERSSVVLVHSWTELCYTVDVRLICIEMRIWVKVLRCQTVINPRTKQGLNQN